MATPEEEFSRYHEKLRSELNKISWHFRVIEYIREIQHNYRRELNQAPTFFNLTINAHMSYVLTRLNNFFDKKEKVKHLHMCSFLDFIEQNLDIFSKQAFDRRLREQDRYDELAEKFNPEITIEEIEQDRAKLGKLPIADLRVWRNKILSHIDKNYVGQNIDVSRKHPIKIKHLNIIINTIHEILNKYYLAYDFSTHSKDLVVEHDIQYILDVIRFKRQS